jgi:hypothetical protein
VVDAGRWLLGWLLDGSWLAAGWLLWALALAAAGCWLLGAFLFFGSSCFS